MERADRLRADPILREIGRLFRGTCFLSFFEIKKNTISASNTVAYWNIRVETLAHKEIRRIGRDEVL